MQYVGPITGSMPNFGPGPIQQIVDLYLDRYEISGIVTGPMGGGRVMRKCYLNFQCRGVLLIWKIVGQRPIALATDGGVWVV